MEREYTTNKLKTIKEIYENKSIRAHVTISTDYSANHTEMLDNINIKTDNLKNLSEQECKEMKIELLRKGFVAVFEDMSLMKNKDQLAKTKKNMKPISLYSLKDKPGIYMITNKVNKKFYIGMTKNIMTRFQTYLSVKCLEKNMTSRINRALLKYGFDKFSVTILETDHKSHVSGTNNDFKFKFKKEKKPTRFSKEGGEDKASKLLRAREDFFIKIFKPQYNIKRYLATRDEEFYSRKLNYFVEIPRKIKELLDKCLDPNFPEHILLRFGWSKKYKLYDFAMAIQKKGIKVNSSGWFEGEITEPKGFEVSIINTVSKEKAIELMISTLVDKEKLAEFYKDKEKGYVIKQWKNKIKALKRECKKEKSNKSN